MHDWIKDDDALRALVDEAAAAPVVGIDTEFMRVRTYWPELALVQVATGQRIALVDPLPIASLEPLAAYLRDGRGIKVMHSASEDLVAFARMGGFPVAPMFDTQIAAAYAGLGAGMGYQRLVATLVGVELEKGETRSDWLKRPLTPEQRHYAALDVAHLIEIYELLRAKLVERGMLAWCEEDCARLARGGLAELGADPHHDFKSAWKWPVEQQARLKRLLEWRDRTARELDRPRLWILDNANAAELAEHPPATLPLLKQRLQGQRGLPKSAHEPLMALVESPLSADEANIRPVPPPLRGEAEARYDRLRDAVAAKAQSLDLPPAILMPRRVLEAVVRGETPDEIVGYRGELFASEIAAARG